jgi:drug/metabolite transporter (DMT)-like permease
MFDKIPPIFYALGATLCFAYSSTIFTEFARKISPFWMNSFKAFIALAAFWFTIFLTGAWITPSWTSVFTLISSGCIGLMIGDIFMLHAMKDLGASRMLMIFGLQPFFLGVSGYFLFDQQFYLLNFIGVLFMLGCLYTISLESYKNSGSWQVRGMTLGLIAIILDAIGILLTKHSFNISPGISSAQVNAIRCLGAVFGFFIINWFYYPKAERIEFLPTWSLLSRNEKIRILLASIGGTYFSLMLYLTAISKGQLSIVSSVSVTGPMFAEVFDCVRRRKLPNRYVFVAFIFFLSGFLIFSQSR